MSPTSKMAYSSLHDDDNGGVDVSDEHLPKRGHSLGQRGIVSAPLLALFNIYIYI